MICYRACRNHPPFSPEDTPHGSAFDDDTRNRKSLMSDTIQKAQVNIHLRFFVMVTSDWCRRILNPNPNAKIPPVMDRSITGGIFIFLLEAPANPCIPLPWDSNITAKGLLYIKIEMCYVAQIEIGADSHFPPTSTEILLQCS